MKRDHAMYDYGRRGCGWSQDDGTSCVHYFQGHETTVPDVGVRKRRRSMSPYERDPRSRFDEHGRQQVNRVSHPTSF